MAATVKNCVQLKLAAWQSQNVFRALLEFLGNITILVSPKWKLF